MALTSPTISSRPRRSLWRRILERPRQIFLRKALFQIHLWAGIIVGLYVIAIGISGSVLVFKEELMPRPSIDVGPVNTKNCEPTKLVDVVDRINRAFPNQLAFLTACPSEANPLYVTTVRDQPKAGANSRQQNRERQNQLVVYSHPATGEIVGTADREHSWVAWVEELHVNLLLGRSGRLWNGIGGAVLLALTLTGMVLWWPGLRSWQRALIVEFRRGWKRINWELHNVAGFWTLFFTLAWALTGMYFTWPKLFTVPIEKISPIVTANYPAVQMRSIGQRPATPKAQLDVLAALRQAKSISPDGYLEGFFYGTGPKPIFTVYMARGRMGDYSNTDFLYFDQHTGKHLLTWNRGKNRSLGDWLVWLVAPVHFGTSWGLAVKWLWFTLGLVLPLLTITGFLMYWNRWLGKHWRKVSRRPSQSLIAHRR